MSSMLEQAIVDAKALKEAALKNAEQAVIDKYSSEIKAAVEELFYSPSLRETIAFGKLVEKGMKPKEAAVIVFGNVYTQWGDIEFQKVNDIITSMFGN